MTTVKYIKPTSKIPVGTIQVMRHQNARALYALGYVEYYIPENLQEIKSDLKPEEIDPLEIELADFAKDFESATEVKAQPVKAEAEKPKRGRPSKK